MTEPLIVIGLCGKARSGKDTVAKILEAHADFQRIALADGVREALNGLDGQTWEYRKERGSKSFDGLTDRWAMQVFGTECRLDACAASHWVDHVAIKIRYASHYHPVPRRRFIISDIRYPFERDELAAVIKEWGSIFYCWRIDRPDTPGIAESSHSSEQYIDLIPADLSINNGGSKEQLARVVLQRLNSVLPSPERPEPPLVDAPQYADTAWGRLPIALDGAHAATG